MNKEKQKKVFSSNGQLSHALPLQLHWLLLSSTVFCNRQKRAGCVVYKRGGTTYVYNLEHKWTFEEEIVLSKISRDNKRLFTKHGKAALNTLT